jgi:hypothetical protein
MVGDADADDARVQRPVSSNGEGRVIAGLLMITGVGLFGTFSGYGAFWFLAPGERRQ